MVEPEHLWMVIVGFIIGFVLAVGVGANDVANAFGTSVGAKTLTLRQACILGTIFETLGAVLLGAKVSDTVRKGVIDAGVYDGEPSLFMAGNVAALSGSCLWLFAATFFKMPVSGTHSIIGAIIGFSLVAKGAAGVNWPKLGLIVASWFISPVASGVASCLLFLLCKYAILRKYAPLEPGLRFLPMFYSVTVVINVFSIFYDGPDLLGFQRIPLWGAMLLAFGTGTILAICVQFLLVPWQRKTIQAFMETRKKERALERQRAKEARAQITRGEIIITDNDMITQSTDILTKTIPMASVTSMVPAAEVENGELANEAYLESVPEMSTTTRTRTISTMSMASTGSSVSRASIREATRSLINDRPQQAKLFSYLQVLTAIFGSFAHGGNDVSNAIGPVVSIWLIWRSGEVATSAATPIWILLLGGAGISVGLWVWGRRVIETLGNDLTKITPSSGFCVELGAALTVLIASNIGIPISSTHCKVGSIVFVGRVRSRDNVDWSIFRNIILAWLLTLPISGGISAALMAGLRLTAYDPVATMNITTTALYNETTMAMTTILY